MMHAVFEQNGRHYRFQIGPHLSKGVDWHDAYIPIVKALLSEYGGAPSEAILLPLYPLIGTPLTDNLLFELGSYWEGAIYFLCHALEERTPLEGLRTIENKRIKYELNAREQLFLTIWNSHGQLKWLKAHLVRENALLLGLLPMHAGSSSEELARAAKSVNDPELKWLTSFVEQHADEGEKYPNPYFGGTNPLHLGLVSINR